MLTSVAERHEIVAAYIKHQTNDAWDEMLRKANQIGMSDGLPDPDLEYAFRCDDCDEEAKWTMNNVVDAGTPVCPDCGEDMELV